MTNLDYLYNPEAVRSLLTKNYFNDKKLGFQVIENGMILPSKTTPTAHGTNALGGIVDNNGTFVKGSAIYETYTDKDYTPPFESIQHSSETVIYLGYFFPVWGHFITDCIRHMWFLHNDSFKNEFKDCPLVYVAWDNRNLETLPRNFSRLLEILGVDLNKVREITQPTKFDKIIMPEGSYSMRDGFTAEYRETIDRVRNFALKNRTPTPSKKVYYFHGRYHYGEERLAQYFKAKGYEIIQPEKLTLDEQLNWLINCESFVSTLGSCSHNSVFLRDGAEAIMIPRMNVERVLGWQPKMDQVHSINTSYVDSSLSIFANFSGYNSFCYIISKQLKDFFGDKWNGYDEEDFKLFLQYVKSAMSRGIEPQSLFKDYYNEVLQDFMAQLKRHKDLIAAYDMPPRWEQFYPPLTYQTHVHMKGWRDGWNIENQPSNPPDQELEILAIQIKYPRYKVYYSVYFNEEEGWSQEVMPPEYAGTVGVRKPIYGMRVRLDEAGAKEFDILYRMHKFDGEWTPWAKNGEELYSHDVKLNAIQIKLEPVKSAEADTKKVDDIKPAEATNRFDYTQTVLLKRDEIYLQGQRQNLTQIKLS